MPRIVLIDGENLVYGLRTLLGKDEERASRLIINNYDFRGLILDLLEDEKPTEILWFGARLRQYDFTEELKEKTRKAIYSQSKLVNQLQQQKITFIKVGYLRARESEPCKNCNNQEWKLLEKGVDVGLSARMIQEAMNSKEIIIMSADTDLLPAIRASKKLGAKTMYIGYEFRPINSLSTATDITRLITKPLATKYLKLNKK